MPETYYKVIGGNNEAAHGGDFDWGDYLPEKDKPGKWTPCVEDAEICLRGYHVTEYWNIWYEKGRRVFECECRGLQRELAPGINMKKVCRSLRLIKEISSEDYESVDQDFNLGPNNTAPYNIGRRNTSHHNAGDGNTGRCNRGSHNSGNRNCGNNNSGSENIGHDNSGGDNQGSRNAGNHNDGYHNVGDWNRANFHVGHFNTEDPSTMLTFNRPCRVSDWNLARKPLFLSRLKKNSSSEDRQKEYDQAPYADKQLLADLPNFDPGIFREITGIRVDRTIGPTIPRDTTVPTREVAGAVPVKIKLVHPDAKVPERATDGSAGYDLVATTAIKNPAGTCVYGTGVAVEIPPDHVGLLFPRSSIAWTGMMVANSVRVIDSDYRGEISAVMHRVRDGVKPPYKEGDRIGQLVIVESPRVKFIQVEELSETTRGQGGYGSTGR